MKISFFFSLIFLALNVQAKPAPKEMKVFNKKCPAPKICKVLFENHQKCQKGQKKMCDEFVANFRKALPEYDCHRPYDVSGKENYIVPAIWMCNLHEPLLSALSKLKTENARKLYGSQELRNTLDGHLAEEHMSKSLKAEKGQDY